MAKLLVIDDDRSIVHLVRSACKALPIDIVAADNAEDGIDLLKREEPDVLLLDIVLPEMNGLELYQKIRQVDERVPVIFITATRDSDTAIEAMKLGALDFLLKPLDVARVEALVKQALEIRRLMESPVPVPEVSPNAAIESPLLGRSPQMLEVYKSIGRVAPKTVTILIRGESGTGKELIARAVYQHSERRNKLFLAVNCAALAETLLESELFGHEQGSFTGASHRRIGKFEQCNGGTIFLDEVGDTSPSMQAKLLRLLQEQQFERVGGTQTIKTDVRIIAATNRDLDAMAEEGTFRADLYYRLNGFTIKLPPLRDRGEDVRLLIESYLARSSREFGIPFQAITPEAMNLLLAYPWPGNVRELQSVLRKSLLNMTGSNLIPDFLPEEIRHPELAQRATASSAKSSAATPATSGESLSAPSASPVAGSTLPSDLGSFLEERLDGKSQNVYAEAIEFLDRYVITRVLKATGGNQSQTAAILGITRGSLRNKIRANGIRIGQVIESGALPTDEE